MVADAHSLVTGELLTFKRTLRQTPAAREHACALYVVNIVPTF